MNARHTLLFLTLALLGGGSQLYSANPDGATRAFLSMKAAQRGSIHKGPAQSSENEDKARYVSTLAEVESEEAVEQMKEMGCVIFGQRDELVLVCIPEEKIQEFMQIPSIGEVSVARACSASCNVVREFSGVDDVLNYNSTGFDGTGVVLGLSDIGFDATHPAFAGRVSRFCGFYDSEGTSFSYDKPEEILAQGTDNPEQTHATMCANILGGAKESSVYFGMAPGSELVAGTSELYDCGLLAAVDKVIDYAQTEGKPAVASISIATYLGPHDGTDLACRYLSKQAKDAVIAISSGNEGNQTCSIVHTFDGETTEIQAGIRPRPFASKKINGSTQIWSSDGQAFGLTLEVWDLKNVCTVYSKEISGGGSVDADDIMLEIAKDPSGLGKFFIGTGIAVSTGIQPCNGQYAAILTYDVETETAYGTMPAYLLVVKIKGTPGQEVRLFADSSHSTFTAPGLYAPFVPGTDLLSVNDLATADGLICVGAVTARKSFELDNGYSFTVNYPYNAVAPFSGYAYSMPGGTTLPHVVAPGTGVMTAVSSYTNPTSGYCVKNAEGKEYYWRADDGTSFSAPTVAGIIALWRQANPGLEPSVLKEIAMTTASDIFSEAAGARGGAGKIEALDGLRKALTTSPTGLGGISACSDEIKFLINGRSIEAFSHKGKLIPEVYTPNGQRLEADNLRPGLYICRANTATNSKTQRIIIK
ncbi:MAG: S8 family peptidase [Muribaculaceae bacterium]|nr:S8 family peptidase [Muribaculaceae bacterium]